MNLKILFFCLVFMVLLMPAEMKPKKDRKHGHRNRGHHHGYGLLGHHKHGRHEKKRLKFEDILRDIFFKLSELDNEEDEDDDDHLEWLFDLQEPEGTCDPNPCFNNGVCKIKNKGKFKCDCPEPYTGMKCQKGPKICKPGLCGRGECVLISNPPFYECKCKEPFKPPNCRKFEVCEPNPCMNGGTCIRDGNDFDCQCPPGYSGRFCDVDPNDCYLDDGESYRGKVSETEDGDECLYWNSHFILEHGTNPFTAFEDKDGLGPHNFCRNPDGDHMPWCFYRRGKKLLWDYCDVTECPLPTDMAPTEIIPPVTDPISAKPKPTKPEPPKPKPTKPEPTADPNPPTTPMTKPPVTTIPPVTTTPPVPEKPCSTPQPTPVPTNGPLVPETTVPPQQFLTCGKPQPRRPITRIFGGLKVPPGAVPWQVSVQVRPKSTNWPYRHICGGVLIESCWVLTAGHCLERGKDMQVVLGSLALDTVEYDSQIINVREAIRHENYRETPAAVYNDIALLKLSGVNGVCANETQFVKRACLPDAQLPDGMECTISGWGITEELENGTNHLLKANVMLINQEKCSEPAIYGNNLDNGMLCAGHLLGGVDSCQGDSGGPLTCKQNNTHVIYGLVSWGDQCGRKNKPGVYTRVTHFLNWINSKTQAASP